METKQTAVEWLEEQLIGKNGINVLKDTFNQAKEMEKQQIVDAHLNGQAEFDKGKFRAEVIKNAEEYYNETFNK
jgi:hypothetical protein